ncbi:MAG: 16S rRNA (guanine(527)-N(7))-methyltransferase RsmG [Thermacetogeniaceae bacterium]
MEESLQELVTGARELGVEIDHERQQQMADYADLLLDWNQRINLVRVSSREELLRAHLLDSLWCSAAVDLRGELRLLDIGSGAGFPGIPLQISWPEMRVYLLESQQKRSLFLAEAVRCLGLANCTVLTGRAENLARDRAYREAFDCAVARAVASLAVLAELALPFVAPGGHFVALKGSAAWAEISDAEYALQQLGGAVERVIPYRFPGEQGRNVVCIKKVAPTPERYPRRTGIPAKRPLLARRDLQENG